MALTQISTGMLASGDGTVDLNIDNGTFVVDVSTSRVGVGNTTPSVKLDITGDMKLSGAADFNGSLDVDGAAAFNSSVTATTLTATTGVLNLDDNGSHNGVINVPAGLFINIDSDNGATNETFRIAKDRTGTSGGTELFRVQEDGNVGIGTSSPSRALATKSSSVTVANFESTSATAGFISFSDSNTTNDVMVRAGAVGNNLVLQAGGTERMRIDASGNVKIGDSATDITSKLVVSGNASADVATFMYDGSAGTYLDIDCGAANGDVTIAADARSGSYPPLVFKTSATERMRIDSSGSLLINSTTTAHTGGNKLYINSGVNAAPVTSGTTQTGGALRLRGANNAVLDMGLNSVYTWIQATDKANLANGYSLTLNPNGGNVGIGTMLPAAALHVDTAANVTTGLGAPLIKVGGDNSWAGNGSFYSVGFGYTDNSIASKSPAEIGFATTSNAGYTRGDLVFALRSGTTNAGPTERIRIESGGDIVHGGSTGIHEKYFSGIVSGNGTVSHDITHTSDASTGTVLHIQASMTHHPSYDCILDTWVSRRSSTFNRSEQFRRDTGVSGAWSVTYVSATVTRITKSAGTYAGGGPYWIKATWRNYQ